MRALFQADFLPGPTATQHTIEISRTKIKTEIKNTKSTKAIIQTTVDFIQHHLVYRPRHKNYIKAAKNYLHQHIYTLQRDQEAGPRTFHFAHRPLFDSLGRRHHTGVSDRIDLKQQELRVRSIALSFPPKN
jgi:hypothetical protein